MLLASFCMPIVALVIALAGVGGANAVSVTPIHIEMTTTGTSGRSQITVTNDAREALPVEVTVQRMVLDENGERKLSKAGDEFLIFPPQASIPAGGTQAFRLQWVGEPMLAESQSYMILVNQVPLKLPPGRSAVQVVMSFGVLVNIAPPQGQSALRLVGTSVVTGKDGKKRPSITVENPTKVHALLPNATLRLSAGNWQQSLTPQQVGDGVRIGLVQPGKTRRFLIPVDLPMNVTQIQASLEYRPKR